MITHCSLTEIECLRDVDPACPARGFKPQGLWLAKDSEWRDWCIDANLQPGEYMYNVQLRNDARLLEIRSAKDAMALPLQRLSTGCARPHWAKLAEQYDGVRVSNYYRIRTEVYTGRATYDFMNFMWLLACDIDCLCIWRPSKVVESMDLLKK